MSDKKKKKINKLPKKIFKTGTDATSEDLSRFFFLTPDYLCITDFKGKIKVINPSLASMLGKDENELANVDIVKFVHKDDIFKLQESFSQLEKGRVGIEFDCRLQHKEGSFRWLAWKAMGNLKSKCIYLAARDITIEKAKEFENKRDQAIAKIGSWRFDLITKEQTWSSEHYKIFEIPEPQSQEKLFQMYQERIHPDDRAELARVIENATKKGEDFIYNHRVYLDGGLRIKHVRGTGSVTRDSEGTPIYVSGICQDLTDMVQLQEQNKFILEAMGIGIWKFNPVSNELHWDNSMYSLFEISAANFSGGYEAWESSLSPEAKAKAVTELQQALSGEKEFDTTFEILTKSGKRKQIGGRGVVLRNPKGEPTMMYGINWDRSKEVMMEENLQQERAKSLHNAKLASLGELSAGIAHEINNPLSVIAGNIAVLRKDPTRLDWLLSKLDQMDRAASRIEKIVKGLRKFSRTSEVNVRKPESLAAIVAESLVLVEPKAKKYSAEIIAEVPADLIISCDSVEIEQVVVNLISNAVDAVKEQVERKVKVTAFSEDKQVVLRVQDSGKGISAEIEKKLFQPFFTTKPIGEGTGIGLSIVKGILDSHNASISLCKGMAGACFEIRFSRHI